MGNIFGRLEGTEPSAGELLSPFYNWPAPSGNCRSNVESRESLSVQYRIIGMDVTVVEGCEANMSDAFRSSSQMILATETGT